LNILILLSQSLAISWALWSILQRIDQNAQEIAKDWLRRIKIYKIRKLDSIFLSNELDLFQVLGILVNSSY
jgi:hypothetical protein